MNENLKFFDFKLQCERVYISKPLRGVLIDGCEHRVEFPAFSFHK